jgi:hypothetical protein
VTDEERLEVERLKMQLSLAQLQIFAARELFVALLTEGDPPEVEYARRAARQWVRENAPSVAETRNALGALLRGDLRA